MTAHHPRLRPVIAEPERVAAIEAFGLDMKILLTTEATGGATSILMAWHKPGEGPPDHVHLRREEIFFVVSGTYELTLGERTATAGPGTVVFIPRNTVHRFKNIGDTTACMLDWSLPGGQDHYFNTIAELAADGGFTGEKALEISKQFDTHFPGAH
jgi:mannose-6-phosphate isomerase-like protein (cupin superfamily)